MNKIISNIIVINSVFIKLIYELGFGEVLVKALTEESYYYCQNCNYLFDQSGLSKMSQLFFYLNS